MNKSRKYIIILAVIICLSFVIYSLKFKIRNGEYLLSLYKISFNSLKISSVDSEEFTDAKLGEREVERFAEILKKADLEQVYNILNSYSYVESKTTYQLRGKNEKARYIFNFYFEDGYFSVHKFESGKEPKEQLFLIDKESAKSLIEEFEEYR